MNQVSKGARAVLLLAFMIAGLVGGSATSAVAQSADVDPDLFVSELSDIEVEVTGGDYEIYDAEAQTYEHGEGEIVQISSNTAYLQVAFYDDTDTNVETLELYNEAFTGDVDAFKVLDEGEANGTVYAFAVATYNDVDFLYYISVTEDVVDNVDVLQRMYAPDTTFFDDLADAQDTIEVDGDGFLLDVDATELEELSGGSADTREDEDEGSTRGRDDDDDPTVEPDDPGTAGEDEGSSEEEETSRRTTGDADYEFQLVPAGLSLSGDAEILDSFFEDPVVEQVQVSVGDTGSLGLIQIMQNPMDAEATLDFMLGNFNESLDSVENIDTDANDTSAWSLDHAVVDGQDAIIFIWVDSERFEGFHYVELLLAPEATFLEELEAFGQSIEVDGDGLFADTGAIDIEALFNGDTATGDSGSDEDSGETGDRSEDEKVDNDEDESGDTSRNRSRDDSDEDTGLDTGSDTDADRDTDTADEPDLESQGLISDSEFESLQHGMIVEWDETVWSVDPTWELSAVSDPESGIDSVILFQEDAGASMMIQIMPSDGSAPADFVDAWSSDDFIVGSVHEDAEVLLADSGRDSGAVVYLSYDDAGDEVILVQEVIDIDGETMAVVTMFGTPDGIADAYADAEDLVSVDGLGIVETFTSREIEGAIEP